MDAAPKSKAPNFARRREPERGPILVVVKAAGKKIISVHCAPAGGLVARIDLSRFTVQSQHYWWQRKSWGWEQMCSEFYAALEHAEDAVWYHQTFRVLAERKVLTEATR